MVKQWKKSLEQSDILSDGTPFDGENIDAPISGVGESPPVDYFTAKQQINNASTGETASVSVTGTGYTTGLVIGIGYDGDNHSVSVTIDGTDIININDQRIDYTNIIPRMRRYTGQNLEIYQYGDLPVKYSDSVYIPHKLKFKNNLSVSVTYEGTSSEDVGASIIGVFTE